MMCQARQGTGPRGVKATSPPDETSPQPRGIAMRAWHRDAQVKLQVATKTAKPVVQIEELVRRRGDERELAGMAPDVLKPLRPASTFARGMR